MFLDPSAGISHINACCSLNPPRAFIGGWKAHLLGVVAKGIRAIPIKLALPSAQISADKKLPEIKIELDDAALITFTSGSTGQPKAAIRTHRFLLAQHQALESSIHLEAGEVDLTTLPIFVLANLASGVTSLLPDANLARPGFVEGAPIARQVARHAPTRTGGSPAFYERLAEKSPEMFQGFRKIYTGGAPVFPNLLHRLHELAPQAHVTAVYGSTEAEPIAEIEFSEIHDADWQGMRSGQGLLTGKPVSQIQLRIMRDQWGTPLGSFTSEEFSALAQSTGPIGEIVVSGNHVLPGYLHGRGDPETKFRVDGTIWHRTGDAGYLDAKGRLWLLGRCSAKIEDERGILYPFTAECVAQAFSFVRRAAFIAHQGQRILLIQTRADVTENQITELETSLVPLQIDRLFRVPRIPVDARHNAKVNYPELRKQLSKIL